MGQANRFEMLSVHCLNWFDPGFSLHEVGSTVSLQGIEFHCQHCNLLTPLEKANIRTNNGTEPQSPGSRT
jgi:hypothetical protein